MSYELDEFRMRVKHNFKVYVILVSKSVNWKEDYILDSIYQLNGYKCHKTVKYVTNSSHIHIKFNEEGTAKEAVEFLNNMDTDLTAVLVDDMLRDWFNYEMKSGHNPNWTLTVVDIIGSPPLDLNFLTDNILNSILRNFGDPYVLPYTAAISEPHVQVLFGSMTEALAACMAFGEWYKGDQKVDLFFHRVRINPSYKEAKLIRNSGGTPKEAFKLDYFVNVRNVIIETQMVDDRKRTQSHKGYRNKVIHKSRKPKSVNNTELKQNVAKHQAAPLTPVLCLPVIAPLNSYAEAVMSSSRQLNTGVANAPLNIRQAVSTQAAVNVDRETDFHLSTLNEKDEIPVISYKSVERLEEISFISDKETLGHVAICDPENTNRISQKPIQKRCVSKRFSRV